MTTLAKQNSMQSFNFALRQSSAGSVDDNRRRYVPSSIYSGPGPAEESSLPPQPIYPQNGLNSMNGANGLNGVRATYNSVQSNPYAQSTQNKRLRISSALNVRDPMVLHLLAETALSDSKEFEILSFEELEQLKRDKIVLHNRTEATKRKLALEYKLRDAAQSLNRLYTKKGSIDTHDTNGRTHSRNTGGSKASNNEALSRANDEYHASNERIEDLTHELKTMEMRLDTTQQRILEHTAGVLQLTHRGLKKNLRKSTMPRAFEDTGSHDRLSVVGPMYPDEFDERSLYPIPDYVHEFAQSNPATPVVSTNRKLSQEAQIPNEIITQLQSLGSRMHDMVQQFSSTDELTPPPDTVGNVVSTQQVQSHIEYLSNGLGILNDVQQRTLEESDNVSARIHKMLEKTESMSRSPLLGQDQPRGEDLASQLAFSTRVLDQLHTRVETLVEQKDILTRQIQQQRELNTKSDAQRDAQIQDLTEELDETKKTQVVAQQEAQELQNQMSMLMEQLDRAKQDALLIEQQRGMNETKALQLERDARKNAERELMSDVETKQQTNLQLQADMAKISNDFEVRSQQHIQQLNELSTAKEEATIEAKKYRSEAEKVLEQMAALQTELTIVKAELDGAYGTRAQRAADVSLNPAIQKEMDLINAKNDQLQKELKETIEDYEQMTKASIEFEKERDQFESLIDSMRDKCESLESQLSEEKLKWLGMKAQAPTETTSTMVLKNEFKKMMRDTRADNTKALRAEQDERRKLEALIRSMRKEAGLATPARSTTGSHLSAEPLTPSASR